MSEPRKLWKIFQLRYRPGKYWNSRLVESWQECGTVHAPDEDAAAARAREIVGNNTNAIRVEPVDEFYRPVSLQ